ncbi:antirestriction protein [Pantoea sp. BL1]|uniref:antirestriction protein n=1 Tax=Pantoea sp. BL1 TaxID=1628190 RepID=UPI001E3484F4|nr:antirestriction protein [Pantoea sp. BL1]
MYLYADRYLSEYDGGVWDFVQLPSGGGLMKPTAEETWRFVNPENYSDVRLSSEAAGIFITSLVLNHRSWMYDRHDDTELCALYCRRPRQLTDYAFAHPEAAAIFAALAQVLRVAGDYLRLEDAQGGEGSALSLWPHENAAMKK